jgi:hypothetical protein
MKLRNGNSPKLLAHRAISGYDKAADRLVRRLPFAC